MDIHPITETELRDFWSETVEGLIKQEKGAAYLGTPTAIANEYHDGDGTSILVVNKPPIASVQSLVLDTGYSYPVADYEVLNNIIRLKTGTFPEGSLNVAVSYTSGTTANVDPVIRLCAATMIVAMINYRSRAGADGSIKFAQNEVREGSRSPNVNVGLITHLRSIMKQLLRKDKVRISG